MDSEQSLRASDAERAATADLLRRHHAEGRLDTAELEERVERCYAAKTRGDLDALTADLPGPHLRRPTRRAGGRRPFMPVPLFPLLVLLVVLSATTGAHVVWLIFPLVFFTCFRMRAHRGRPSA
jgi:hypothetical protein